MDTEDILRNYKLREPSADLKARIDGATRDEWERHSDGTVIEFPGSVWRMAIGLAASVLIAVMGNTVNSVITVPGEEQGLAVVEESIPDMDLGTEIKGLLSLRSFTVVQQHADLSGFVRERNVLMQELKVGNSGQEFLKNGG